MLNYGEPASGARLVQGAVAGVVSVVHVTDSVLQAVENHLLRTQRASRGWWLSGTRGTLTSCILPPQELHRGACAASCARTCFSPVTLTSKNIHPHTHTHTSARAHRICHSFAHKCSIIKEMVPKPIMETKCDSTVFYMPDSAQARVCECVNACVTAKLGCCCGSQFRRLSSEHGKMETEQRDLTEALKHLRRSRKLFLWSWTATAGDPAQSSQTDLFSRDWRRISCC